MIGVFFFFVHATKKHDEPVATFPTGFEPLARVTDSVLH